jgi:hypothetical protein
MKINIDKLLFIDIETVSEEISIDGLDARKKRVWESLIDVFERRVTDTTKLGDLYVDGDVSHETLYKYTASLYPEFGKICCISMGFVTKEGEVRYTSFGGDNEKEILKKGFTLCGQNIKNFDVPFMGKRFLINGLKPPVMFPNYDTKPWDLKMVDIKDVWSFGGRYGLSSLDLVCSSMDIESTEGDEINGENIGEYFWNEEYDDIVTHCEKDVKSCIDIIQKINNLK